MAILDEIKVLSGIPLTEEKMPPRGKESIHKASNGSSFTLAPVKVKAGEWKAVKKGSLMDNDWLVKAGVSGKAVAIVSYDEGAGEWNLQKVSGSKVKSSVTASGSLADVLAKA